MRAMFIMAKAEGKALVIAHGGVEYEFTLTNFRVKGENEWITLDKNNPLFESIVKAFVEDKTHEFEEMLIRKKVKNLFGDNSVEEVVENLREEADPPNKPTLYIKDEGRAMITDGKIAFEFFFEDPLPAPRCKGYFVSKGYTSNATLKTEDNPEKVFELFYALRELYELFVVDFGGQLLQKYRAGEISIEAVKTRVTEALKYVKEAAEAGATPRFLRKIAAKVILNPDAKTLKQIEQSINRMKMERKIEAEGRWGIEIAGRGYFVISGYPWGKREKYFVTKTGEVYEVKQPYRLLSKGYSEKYIGEKVDDPLLKEKIYEALSTRYPEFAILRIKEKEA